MRTKKVSILIVDVKQKDSHGKLLFTLVEGFKKFLGASLASITKKVVCFRFLRTANLSFKKVTPSTSF